MKSRTFAAPVLSLAVAFALAACGGSGDSETSSDAGSVPESALASPEAFVSFQQGLAVNDIIEPLSLQKLLPPLSDTTEPVSVGGG